MRNIQERTTSGIHEETHDIDVAAMQETKIPQAAEERRKGYILLFSTSATQGRERWGVGWRYKETLEPYSCLLYTSPSPRDKRQSRMPSSA